MEDIAKKVLATVKAMVPGRFDTELASPRTHPHVDWKAYERVRDVAAGLGLQHLGDVDVVSVHLDPAMMKRAVLAVFVSDDGTEVVAHYRLVLRWTVTGILARFMGVRGDIFDVNTYFGAGQGVMLHTTSARTSAVWQSPDFVQREAMDHGTSLADLLERHRQRVREYRLQHPDARATVVRTLQETFAISNVIEQRKLAWRRELGWATREELAAVSKAGGETVDQLYAAFRKVADEKL